MKKAIPTFPHALDGSVVLKAQVELRIHQRGDTLQHYGRVFEKQVFEDWVLLSRWAKEVEVTLGVHAKVGLPGEKKNQPLSFQSTWKVGKEQAKPWGKGRGGRGRIAELEDTCAFERKFQISSTLLSSRATTA